MRRSSTCRFSLVSVLGALVGCTPTLEFQQCRNDLDCRNAGETELVCTSDHTCEPPLRPEDEMCTTGWECREAFGAHHVCGPRGVCASLLNEQCNELWLPATADPDRTTFIASILPDGDARLASRLAAERFSGIGWIGCHNDPSGVQSQRTVQALLEAGVQAFVAGQTSEEMTALTSRTIAAGALLVSPIAKGISIGALSDAQLVWRTTPSDRLEASAIADRLLGLDPQPRQLLVLAPQDFTGREFEAALSARLSTAAVPFNQATLLYPPPQAFGSTAERLATYISIVSQGMEHEPEAVVLLGGYESTELALQLLLQRDQTVPRPPLPYFVFARESVPFLPAMLNAVDPSFRSTLAESLEGITPRWADEEHAARFVESMTQRFGITVPSRSATLSYDAMLLTALAIKASGEERPSGRTLAAVMPRLFDPSAETYDFAMDPQAVMTALPHLMDGGSVQTSGFSGLLEFEASSGDRWSDFSSWQFQDASTGSSPTSLRETGIYEVEAAPAVDGIWTELR